MCKYCEGAALGCLQCAHACMLEKWHEHAARCRMCKPMAREQIGELPRFDFCPYCGRRLPAYKPDGERPTKEKDAEKKAEKKRRAGWTKAETEALIRLRSSGVSYKDCATALVKSLSEVQNKLHYMIKQEKSGSKDAGKTVKQSEEWTQEETEQLIRMRQSRVQYKDCASELGKSIKAVEYKLRLLKKEGKLK